MTLAPQLMSSARHDWETPDCVLERVRRIGPIALDPCTVCSNPTGAEVFVAPPADSLRLSWDCGGLVFCNPPYGRALAHWAYKIAEQAAAGVEIVTLVPARTDTRWFSGLFRVADAWCFWSGRLTFRGAPASAPFPSALTYHGPRPEAFLDAFRDAGLVGGAAE